MHKNQTVHAYFSIIFRTFAARKYKRMLLTVRQESITTIPKGLRLKEPPSSIKQELDRKIRLFLYVT